MRLSLAQNESLVLRAAYLQVDAVRADRRRVDQVLAQEEIDLLLQGVPTTILQRNSNERLRVQDMDFRRPSKFSKDQLSTLELLHEQFARLGSTHLAGALRAVSRISVSGAEQATYGSFVESLPTPTVTAVLELEPLGTNAIMSIDLGLMFAIIGRLLGGTSSIDSELRELTEIEQALAQSILTQLLAELSSSWKDLVGVDFHLHHLEMNPQLAQIAPPTDLAVLLSFAVSIDSTDGDMTLCLPWSSIETVAPSLTANSYFSGKTHRSIDLITPLESVEVEIRAEIGAVPMTIEELLSVEPGDVIRLGRAAEQGVLLIAGSTPIAYATPGVRNGHVAVQIYEQLVGTMQEDAGLLELPPGEMGAEL